MEILSKDNLDYPKKSYFIYIVRCTDNSLYCGFTTNLTRRINEHNSSVKGARYTKGKRPVVLVYSEEFSDRSLALKREYAIKRLSKAEKIMLCQENKN